MSTVFLSRVFPILTPNHVSFRIRTTYTGNGHLNKSWNKYWKLGTCWVEMFGADARRVLSATQRGQISCTLEENLSTYHADMIWTPRILRLLISPTSKHQTADRSMNNKWFLSEVHLVSWLIRNNLMVCQYRVIGRPWPNGLASICALSYTI